MGVRRRVLLLVLGLMGMLGRHLAVGCGSSTSTALRAEYECEYGRGKVRSGAPSRMEIPDAMAAPRPKRKTPERRLLARFTFLKPS
jgi:hypothetical protein